MAFSNIGFSTGALAKGDFHRALSLLRATHLAVVELSALRESELPELMDSLDALDLTPFSYVSVHVPTVLKHMTEGAVIECLKPALRKQLPVIVHPDIIRNHEIWRTRVGSLLTIENMDKRKPGGKTVAELAEVFSALPESGFCFDVAHAAQVDPSMTEAAQILRNFGSRIRQVHASGVNTSSGHGKLSITASFSISRISHLVPPNVPIILESPVDDEHSIVNEVQFARIAFHPWLERLYSDVDSVFDFKTASLRRSQAVNFLKTLQQAGIRLSDLEGVITWLPSGGPHKRGDAMLNATDLFSRLSESERIDLQRYLVEKVSQILIDFPELRGEFENQLQGFENVLFT